MSGTGWDAPDRPPAGPVPPLEEDATDPGAERIDDAVGEADPVEGVPPIGGADQDEGEGADQGTDPDEDEGADQHEDEGPDEGVGGPDLEAEPAVAVGEGRRARRLNVAVAVLGALAAALAVTAGVLYSRLEAERGRTDDVERVAGQFAAAVASYDYRNLDAAKDEVLALSTGGFRKDYEARFDDLRTVLEATKGSATTTVKAVYLGDLEDDQATAFVIVDVNVEGTSGRRQLVNEYLELSLVRLDEGWKVDNVRNLNFGRRATSAAGSPSTTAPATGGGAAPSG